MTDMLTQTMVRDVAEALRCTDFIEDREIRAKYIVQTLKIDGYQLQAEPPRLPNGRFSRRVPESEER